MILYFYTYIQLHIKRENIDQEIDSPTEERVSVNFICNVWFIGTYKYYVGYRVFIGAKRVSEG